VILSRYERMIARRYLMPGKGEGIIAVVAGFSLGGVMLGVAALVIVMSVMNGFRAELFDKIVSLNGHAVIQGYAGRLPDWQPIVRQAQATPGVTQAIPLIEQPLMASYQGRVEAVLARNDAVAVIHARDGGDDGKRKLGQSARRATDGAGIPVVELFASAQMDLALGRQNVIHAALLAGPVSNAFLARAQELARYRAEAGMPVPVQDDETGQPAETDME